MTYYLPILYKRIGLIARLARIQQVSSTTIGSIILLLVVMAAAKILLPECNAEDSLKYFYQKLGEKMKAEKVPLAKLGRLARISAGGSLRIFFVGDIGGFESSMSRVFQTIITHRIIKLLTIL